MNKYQALQSFLEKVGVPVYAESSVPEQAEYPYMTYSQVDGDFMSGETSMNVNLWCYTDTESQPNELVFQLSKLVGFGGTTLIYDTGAIWVKKGSPFAQNIPDESNVKHRYINLDLEFLSFI